MEPRTPRKKIMNDMVVVPKKTTPLSHVPKKNPELVKKNEPVLIQQVPQRLPPVVPYEKQAGNKKPLGCAVWLVASIAGVVLAGVVGGLFAHATITITPWSRTGEIAMNASFANRPTEGKIFFATAQKKFTETIVIPSNITSGIDQVATGAVRFFNTGTAPVTIPSKTIVTNSQGYQYHTEKTIVVGPIKQQIPGAADATISALLPGARFNSQLDDFVLPDTFPKTLQVKSLTPLTGGAQKMELQTSPELLETTISELKKRFKSDIFSDRMIQEIPDTFFVLPHSIPRTDPLIRVLYDQPDGIHVVAEETITLGMVSKEDVARMVIPEIDPSLISKNSTLGTPSELVLTTTAITGSVVPEVFQGRLSGSVTITSQVSTEPIKQALKGLSRSQVKEFLKNIPEIGAFSVRMMPPWRILVPASEKDIDILIKNQ